MDKLHKQRDAT